MHLQKITLKSYMYSYIFPIQKKKRIFPANFLTLYFSHESALNNRFNDKEHTYSGFKATTFK